MVVIVLQRPIVLGAWVSPIGSNSSACRGTFVLFCGRQTRSSLLLTTKGHHWCSWKQWLAGSLGVRPPGGLPLRCHRERAALSLHPEALVSWLMVLLGWLRIPNVVRALG